MKTMDNEPTLLTSILLINLNQYPCSNINKDSAAKLEKVVKAPKNPVKRNKRNDSSALKRPTNTIRKNQLEKNLVCSLKEYHKEI